MQILSIGFSKLFWTSVILGVATVPTGCCPRAHVAPVVAIAEPMPVPQPPLKPDPVAFHPTEPPQEDLVTKDDLPETGKRHEISPFSKALRVAPGDLITHTFEQHESVGKDGTASVADPAVVTFLRRDTIYKHPDKMAPGMTGGDAASATFVFKALKAGATQITIQHTFRGKVEHTIEVQVVVE